MKRDTISAVHLWPKGDDGLVRVPYGFADGAEKLGKFYYFNIRYLTQLRMCTTTTIKFYSFVS